MDKKFIFLIIALFLSLNVFARNIGDEINCNTYPYSWCDDFADGVMNQSSLGHSGTGGTLSESNGWTLLKIGTGVGDLTFVNGSVNPLIKSYAVSFAVEMKINSTQVGEPYIWMDDITPAWTGKFFCDMDGSNTDIPECDPLTEVSAKVLKENANITLLIQYNATNNNLNLSFYNDTGFQFKASTNAIDLDLTALSFVFMPLGSAQISISYIASCENTTNISSCEVSPTTPTLSITNLYPIDNQNFLNNYTGFFNFTTDSISNCTINNTLWSNFSSNGTLFSYYNTNADIKKYSIYTNCTSGTLKANSTVNFVVNNSISWLGSMFPNNYTQFGTNSINFWATYNSTVNTTSCMYLDGSLWNCQYFSGSTFINHTIPSLITSGEHLFNFTFYDGLNTISTPTYL